MGHPVHLHAGHPYDYAGRTFHFVERPPERLICVVCHELSQEPDQATCCGKIYCAPCIKSWKTNSNSCPFCRRTEQSDVPFRLFPDTRAQQEIRCLVVLCPNWKHGCDRIIELSEVENHLSLESGCPFQIVDCGNKCGHKDMRIGLKKHMTSECRLRQEKCQYCALVSTYEQVTGAHLKECPGYPVTCPNKCNVRGLTRFAVPAH